MKLADAVCDALFLSLCVLTAISVTNIGTHIRLLWWIGVISVLITAMNTLSLHGGQLISRTILRSPPFNDPLHKAKSRRKFVAQFWQLVIHVGMSAYGWSLVKDEDGWITRPWQLASWAELRGKDEKVEILGFYYVQLAIWLVTCFSHKFVQERSKDYYVMYAHHIATIAVVLYSLVYRQLRYGLVVFFLHDVSDILLDVLKLGNILKLEGKHAFFFTEIVYFLMMGGWILARMWYFPRLIFYGLWVNLSSGGVLPDGSRTFYDELMATDPSMYDRLCLGVLICGAGCLTLLFFMHIWWTILLFRIAFRVLVAKEDSHKVGDQEYEGASDEEGESSEKKRRGGKKKD